MGKDLKALLVHFLDFSQILAAWILAARRDQPLRRGQGWRASCCLIN